MNDARTAVCAVKVRRVMKPPLPPLAQVVFQQQEAVQKTQKILRRIRKQQENGKKKEKKVVGQPNPTHARARGLFHGGYAVQAVASAATGMHPGVHPGMPENMPEGMVPPNAGGLPTALPAAKKRSQPAAGKDGNVVSRASKHSRTAAGHQPGGCVKQEPGAMGPGTSVAILAATATGPVGGSNQNGQQLQPEQRSKVIVAPAFQAVQKTSVQQLDSDNNPVQAQQSSSGGVGPDWRAPGRDQPHAADTYSRVHSQPQAEPAPPPPPQKKRRRSTSTGTGSGGGGMGKLGKLGSLARMALAAGGGGGGTGGIPEGGTGPATPGTYSYSQGPTDSARHVAAGAAAATAARSADLPSGVKQETTGGGKVKVEAVASGKPAGRPTVPRSNGGQSRSRSRAGQWPAPLPAESVANGPGSMGGTGGTPEGGSSAAGLVPPGTSFAVPPVQQLLEACPEVVAVIPEAGVSQQLSQQQRPNPRPRLVLHQPPKSAPESPGGGGGLPVGAGVVGMAGTAQTGSPQKMNARGLGVTASAPTMTEAAKRRPSGPRFNYKAMPSPPIFSPTEAELTNPLEYIRDVVVPAAANFGIAVIRPPLGKDLSAECKRMIREVLAKPFSFKHQMQNGNKISRKKVSLDDWKAAAEHDARRPAWVNSSGHGSGLAVPDDEGFFSMMGMKVSHDGLQLQSSLWRIPTAAVSEHVIHNSIHN